MVETAAPETPAQLLTALQAIFPGFEYQVDSDDLRPLTFHGILVDFIDYFGANNSAFDERQLQAEFADNRIDRASMTMPSSSD